MLALPSRCDGAAQTPFKIGISAPVVNILPVWMGEAGGFYGKEGLKVEVINMEGGTRGLQVLLSGEIQAMHVGLAPVVLANKQGADLRLITSSVNTIPITMFTKAGVTMKDLKGKNIGISTFGSETDIAVSILLKQQGLTRQDVTVTQIGGSSQRFAALVAGRIDVAPLIEPAISQAVERGLSPLIDLAAAKTPWIFDSVVVQQQLPQEEPRYAHALREGLCRRRLSRALRLRRRPRKSSRSASAPRTRRSSTRPTTTSAARCRATQHRPSPARRTCWISSWRSAPISAAGIRTTISISASSNALKKDGYFDQMAKTYPIK